jgi:hypothetical protein
VRRLLVPSLVLVAALFAPLARGDGPPPTPSPAPAPPPAGSPPPASTRPKGPAPKITFDHELHDFGAARQEADLKAAIVVTNAGDAVLHVKDVRADCGCSTTRLAVRELAPGAAAPIDVVFHTFTMNGRLTKRLHVHSDDPDRPVAELLLRVDVSAGIVLEPGRFYFGPVLAGQAPSMDVVLRWKEEVGRPFSITSMEAPGMDLQFTKKPFDEPPWHGFRVTAKFRKPPAVGTVSGTALIRTDDPDYPRIDAAVTAFVSGKVWLDQRSVSLGMVPPGADREVMVGCRALSPDVDLGTVTAKSKEGLVEVRVVPGGKSDWLVGIRVPTDAKPGRLSDVVLVSSSIPGEPPAEIAVSGRVLEAGK